MSRCYFLEVVDEITSEDELVLFRSSVVGGLVVGTFKAYFGTDQDSASEPVSPAEQVLGVAGPKTGSLAADVIEVFVANGEIVFGGKFFQIGRAHV